MLNRNQLKGLTTVTTGDLVVISGTSGSLGVIADVAVGQVLVSGGVGAVPAFSTSPDLTAITYYETILVNEATADITAAQMKGQSHRVTGNYILDLPTAVAGYHARFIATTAAIFTLELETGTDIIILNGTALAAGNKAVSDGTINATVHVECTEAGYYRVNSILGVWADGGA